MHFHYFPISLLRFSGICFQTLFCYFLLFFILPLINHTKTKETNAHHVHDVKFFKVTLLPIFCLMNILMVCMYPPRPQGAVTFHSLPSLFTVPLMKITDFLTRRIILLLSIYAMILFFFILVSSLKHVQIILKLIITVNLT